MKKCSRCKEEKSEENFYKDKRASDGLNCACKICVNGVNRKWLHDNPQKALELSRNSHKRHREADKRRAKAYRKKKFAEDPNEYRHKKTEWELKNPEKVREIRRRAQKKFYENYENYRKAYEANRVWAKNNPDKIKEYRCRGAALARQRWPEKDKARKLVAYAVEIGHMIKPTSCTKCLAAGLVEGHHPDYSKPLEVIWLCRQCHNKEHGKLTRQTLRRM